MMEQFINCVASAYAIVLNFVDDKNQLVFFNIHYACVRKNCPMHQSNSVLLWVSSYMHDWYISIILVVQQVFVQKINSSK